MAAASAAVLALASAAGSVALVAGRGALAAGAALVAMGAALMLRRALATLVPASHAVPLEAPYPSAGTQHYAARLVTLEAQLEFAPVALFDIMEGGAPAGAPALNALNASARRLLAPGRVVSPATLHGQLTALDASTRRVIEFETERGCERALATKVGLTIEGQRRALVALMPMESELQAEAIEAGQKLVQVLSHEIMNSLTPVASLTHTSRDLLAGAELPSDVAADLALALDAIGRRADSLVRFVSVYRTLASVPEPVAQPIVIADMLARLEALVGPEWQARGGRAVFVTEPASLTLLADAGQLEQALVNLVRNAAQATSHLPAPHLSVSARLTRGERLRIEVRDNGPGVPDELIRQIFTPFFSTREEGSGIGLAMVRQLVHRNGGAVRYAKSVGAGACFVLSF